MSNHKIVILDTQVLSCSEENWGRLREFGDVSFYDYTPYEKIPEVIGDADIVVLDKADFDEKILQACPNIKFVSVLATGYNTVDTAACKRRGIPVANVPRYAGAIVAQHTFALILEIYNKAGLYNESAHAGDWAKAKYFSYDIAPVYELAGKTLGIIGLGDIGMRVARIAKAFGMKVVAYSRSLGTGFHREDVEYTELDVLLSESDIVTLHAPLTVENTEMINKETIAMMKDGAVLINAARGGLINEQDLADALNSGKLMAAGLDVLTEEPPSADNPLFAAKNCIITPHKAWMSEEAMQRIVDVTYENVKGYIEGQLQNIVN